MVLVLRSGQYRTPRYFDVAHTEDHRVPYALVASCTEHHGIWTRATPWCPVEYRVCCGLEPPGNLLGQVLRRVCRGWGEQGEVQGLGDVPTRHRAEERFCAGFGPSWAPEWAPAMHPRLPVRRARRPAAQCAVRIDRKIEYMCAIVREAINIQYIVNSCRPRRRRAASRETFPKILAVSVLVLGQKPLKEPFLNLFSP